MNIEVRDLLREDEMLSHIFLGCIPLEQLTEIKEKYVGDKDWAKESVKIPVDLKIGGVKVNPKSFFDAWKDQMNDMVLERAKVLVAEKMGSRKMIDLQDKLSQMEQVMAEWEKEINWDVPNPLK